MQLFRFSFHLVKNMKQLHEAGLVIRYNNEADLALEARMIIALVFVPLDSLEDALDGLNSIDLTIAPVCKWFELNYIGA